MNIFLISPRKGPEDRFTAHWAYLLDNHPELGQRVVDHLCGAAGRPSSRFVRADDHPDYGREDQPDLRFVCEDFDILVEHKLDADLGVDQLGRYARLATPGRIAHVALISNRSDLGTVDPGAVGANYLYPTTSGRPFFVWEDLYPLVRRTPGRLAAEFSAYMGSLGMEPIEASEVGDPFLSPTAAARFRAHFEPVKGLFRREARKQVDRVNLGMQVQRPFEGVHLIHMGAWKPSGWHLSHPISGKCMYLRVLGHDARTGIRALPEPSRRLPVPGGGGSISVVSPSTPARQGSGYRLVREYALSLHDILAGDLNETQQRLLDFVSACVADLEATLARRTHEPDAETGIEVTT